MATLQVAGTCFAAKTIPSFEGLCPSRVRVSSFGTYGVELSKRPSLRLSVKAATVVAPKYTAIKPVGERVLVKIKTVEKKTVGGILLLSTTQTKPQRGEVVAVGDGSKEFCIGFR